MRVKNYSRFISKNQMETDIFVKSQLPLNQLSQILNNNPLLINSIDKNGETLFSYALNKNNYEIFDLFLSSPILNLNYKDNEGNSYLHLAV